MILIVHIISRSSFTKGYIKFMLLQFPEYDNVFFTPQGPYHLDTFGNCLVYEFKSYNEFFKNNEYSKIMKLADKIIISGAWLTIGEIAVLVLNNLLHKTFFQFWGGEFYSFRNKGCNLKSNIKKMLYNYLFKHAAGLIFLIDGEYEKFQEIMHVANRTFVAPMPGDPDRKIDFAKYRDLKIKHDDEGNVINVIVGNSATQTNQHKEVFRFLEHYKDNNIKIFCPLSYGDKAYGEEIASLGFKIFGDKFIPIFNLMEFDDYLSFLSKMDLGIFYNDRQQAMGNIYMMLALGKKIFLRPGTSMWHNFNKIGYCVFSADDITKTKFTEFCKFNYEEQNINVLLGSCDGTENAKRAWSCVFESSVEKD